MTLSEISNILRKQVLFFFAQNFLKEKSFIVFDRFRVLRLVTVECVSGKPIMEHCTQSLKWF